MGAQGLATAEDSVLWHLVLGFLALGYSRPWSLSLVLALCGLLRLDMILVSVSSVCVSLALWYRYLCLRARASVLSFFNVVTSLFPTLPLIPFYPHLFIINTVSIFSFMSTVYFSKCNMDR